MARHESEERRMVPSVALAKGGWKKSKPMYVVYRIRSRRNPEVVYIGVTRNLQKRLEGHRTGTTRATHGVTDWEVVFYAAFRDKQTAFDFERYLKSGSGIAFGKKRLWPEIR